MSPPNWNHTALCSLKLKWQFSLYSLSETWISETLDSQIHQYYQKWLNIPISRNITRLTLPKSKLGLSIKTCQQIYVECKLGVCRILKTSLNEDIRNLYKLTSTKNVNSDSILEKINSTEKRTIKNQSYALLSSQSKESTWTSFLNFKEQCGIISFLVNLIPPTHLVQWQKMTSLLPKNIHNFARQYHIYSLSNATNLQRWKLKENYNCFLCDHKETQIHLFNNYKSALNRHEWWHNYILKNLMKNFVTIASEGFRLYADVDGYDCLSHLFRSSRSQDPDANKYWTRPDIAIQERNKTTIIELTCSFKTNLEKPRDYKKASYKNLSSALFSPCTHFNLILLEISSSGFTGSTKSFEQFLKSKDLDAKRIIWKCQEVALRALYFMYCRPNKTWSEPDLISFT